MPFLEKAGFQVNNILACLLVTTCLWLRGTLNALEDLS